MEDADYVRSVSLADEFSEHAKMNKNVSEFQYFVDELDKIPIEEIH